MGQANPVGQQGGIRPAWQDVAGRLDDPRECITVDRLFICY